MLGFFLLLTLATTTHLVCLLLTNGGEAATADVLLATKWEKAEKKTIKGHYCYDYY